MNYTITRGNSEEKNTAVKNYNLEMKTKFNFRTKRLRQVSLLFGRFHWPTDHINHQPMTVHLFAQTHCVKIQDRPRPCTITHDARLRSVLVHFTMSVRGQLTSHVLVADRTSSPKGRKIHCSILFLD